MDYIVTVYRIPKNSNKNNKLLLDKLKEQINSTIKYDELPIQFTKLEEWPRRSNLLCINCHCKTRRYPFFIPQRITSSGYFVRNDNPITCSPNCAMSYVNSRDIGMNRENFQRNIIELTKKMTGINDITVIVPSHNPKKLKKFGGIVTDEEYQYNIYITNEKIIKKLYSTQSLFKEDIKSYTR